MAQNKRKLYFAIMILSGAALLADRLVFSEETLAPAQASEVDPALYTADSGDRLAIPELRFPHDVRPLDPGAEVPDLFAPPTVRTSGDSHEDRTDNPPSGPPSPGAPGRLACEVFARAHRLNGVLLNGRLKIAKVDARWMRVGDEADGCTLIDIRGRAVLFRCYDGDIVLSMDGAMETPPD